MYSGFSLGLTKSKQKRHFFFKLTFRGIFCCLELNKEVIASAETGADKIPFDCLNNLRIYVKFKKNMLRKLF